MRIIYVYSYIDVDIFIMRWNNRNFMILQRALHLWLAMYKWTRIIIWTIFSCCCNVCELTVYARQQKNNKKKCSLMLFDIQYSYIQYFFVLFAVSCFIFCVVLFYPLALFAGPKTTIMTTNHHTERPNVVFGLLCRTRSMHGALLCYAIGAIHFSLCGQNVQAVSALVFWCYNVAQTR